MKIVLAGAYGNLGAEILKELLKAGHEVVCADIAERDLGLEGNYTFKKIDATDPATLTGLCDGADIVISTVGLTGASTRFTSYHVSALEEQGTARCKTRRPFADSGHAACNGEGCLRQTHRRRCGGVYSSLGQENQEGPG